MHSRTSSIPKTMPSISHSRLLTIVPTARVLDRENESHDGIYKTAAQSPQPGPSPQTEPSAKYCCCAWNSSYKKDKELLEKIQHTYTKMVINMWGKMCEKRLKSLWLWTLEERRNRQDIIEVLKCMEAIALSHCMNSLR